MASWNGSGDIMRGENVAGREGWARWALGLGSLSSQLIVRPLVAMQGVVKGSKSHSGFFPLAFWAATDCLWRAETMWRAAPLWERPVGIFLRSMGTTSSGFTDFQLFGSPQSRRGQDHASTMGPYEV